MRLLTCILFFISVALKAQVDHIGSGRAIQFNGVDNYVSYGDIYNNLVQPFSISAWVYLDADSQLNPIFCTNDNPIVYRGFIFFISQQSMGCEFGDGTGGNNPAYRRGKIASVQNVTGRWIHVCAVMTAPFNIDLYINGINIGGNSSGESNLPMATSAVGDVAKSGFYISNSSTYRFKGMIDELQIWNRSLTANEVQQNMCKKLTGNESGLIGYWNFDETNGATVGDKSVNGFNGTLVNNPTRVYSGAPIGDDSKYLYTSNWSGTTLSFQDNNDLVTASNVQGAPQGIHIYEVKSLPSQTGGLNTNAIRQPYFGAFIASLDADNEFDILYSYGELNSCTVSLRQDNSQANWTSSNNPAVSILQRTEIIQSQIQSLSFNLGADQSLCEFKPFTLTPFQDPTGLTFTWQNNSHQSTFMVTDFGKYWVTVSDGCSHFTDTIKVTKSVQAVGFVPNVIIPDGTVPNQHFKVDDSLKGNVSLLVLNRWGKEVYKSDAYQNDWNGGSLSPGVYYVVINGSCINEFKDWLTIIH